METKGEHGRSLHSRVVNGVETCYFDRGPRDAEDTLLFLHGGQFGSSIPIAHEGFYRNLSALSSRSRVLALDRLGQGDTDMPASQQAWTFSSVKKHILSFIRDLRLNSLTLVGHSRGGLFASAIALDEPTRVRRLVIAASATTAPEARESPSEQFYEEFAQSAPWHLGARAVVDSYRVAHGDRDWGESLVALLADRIDGSRHRDRVAGLAQNRQVWKDSLKIARVSTLEALSNGQLQMPVHLIWGADDRSAPVSLGLTLLERLVDNGTPASMHVVPEAGHYVFCERPLYFNQIIRSLIGMPPRSRSDRNK